MRVSLSSDQLKETFGMSQPNESEKKLAEIRATYDRTFGNVTGQMVLSHDQVHFLLTQIQQTREELEQLREDQHQNAPDLFHTLNIELEQLKAEKESTNQVIQSISTSSTYKEIEINRLRKRLDRAEAERDELKAITETCDGTGEVKS